MSQNASGHDGVAATGCHGMPHKQNYKVLSLSEVLERVSGAASAHKQTYGRMHGEADPIG